MRLVFVALFICACAHERSPGFLRIGCVLPEAEVYVDDFYLGRCERWAKAPLRLKPGFHTVEVRAVGHYPFYGEIELAADGRARLETSLRKSLD